MISFLFWNLHGNPAQNIIANIVLQHNVDVIMLVEFKIQPVELLRLLNRNTVSYYYVPQIGCEKVEIFTRFSPDFIPAVNENDRCTIRHLQLPGLLDILLAIIHYPSKLYWKETDQAQGCVLLSNTIREEETRIGHSRTILVGDFNMNPFENGVVSAFGLHGVMDRRIAESNSRIVSGQSYNFFYNPMWGFWGDRNSHPPGTYFYRNAEPSVYFWNIFDQVLIRPDLLPLFDNKDLEVLVTDGNISLLNNQGLPDNSISDHLPILFKLSL